MTEFHIVDVHAFSVVFRSFDVGYLPSFSRTSLAIAGLTIQCQLKIVWFYKSYTSFCLPKNANFVFYFYLFLRRAGISEFRKTIILVPIRRWKNSDDRYDWLSDCQGRTDGQNFFMNIALCVSFTWNAKPWLSVSWCEHSYHSHYHLQSIQMSKPISEKSV